MITDEQVESINQITEAMHTNSADHGFHVNDSTLGITLVETEIFLWSLWHRFTQV